MKSCTSYVFLLACFSFLAIIFSKDGNYSKVMELRETLKIQEQINYALIKEIRDYKNEIIGIQTDDRVLEKAVRNKYAMGRKGETIVVFKKKQ